MILLTVTLCMAAEGEAACRRHVEIAPSVPACMEKGALHVEYIKSADATGRVIFTGWTCKAGRDG